MYYYTIIFKDKDDSVYPKNFAIPTSTYTKI